ncbi:MAG TPA: hypothetical protein VIM53_00600 [Candidatus Saccharimonadales bacterium]
MSKESSSVAWFNKMSPRTRAALLGGSALAAAFALAGCAPGSGGDQTPTSAATTVQQGEALSPSCTKITVDHDKGSYEVTFGIEGRTDDPPEYSLGQVIYDFGDGHATTHGTPSYDTYTYRKAGTYDVTGSITIEPAPGVTNIPAGPDVKNDPNAYPCPPVEVTVP